LRIAAENTHKACTSIHFVARAREAFLRRILLRDLRMPDFREYAVDVPSPGVRGIGDTHVLGRFLRDVAKLNTEQRNFRVFGPDETLSNGLEALFDVTNRQWDAATAPNDEFLAPTGRVMEMLTSTNVRAG
jgi:xylulose-5-phosphate/fructose-6-phosphate phosphoketolase